MHDSNRNTLGHQNSYSSKDIRNQNMQQRQDGVQEHYKPPEVKTTGNPFNAEVQDQWEGQGPTDRLQTFEIFRLTLTGLSVEPWERRNCWSNVLSNG